MKSTIYQYHSLLLRSKPMRKASSDSSAHYYWTSTLHRGRLYYSRGYRTNSPQVMTTGQKWKPLEVRVRFTVCMMWLANSIYHTVITAAPLPRFDRTTLNPARPLSLMRFLLPSALCSVQVCHRQFSYYSCLEMMRLQGKFWVTCWTPRDIADFSGL